MGWGGESVREEAGGGRWGGGGREVRVESVAGWLVVGFWVGWDGRGCGVLVARWAGSREERGGFCAGTGRGGPAAGSSLGRWVRS